MMTKFEDLRMGFAIDDDNNALFAVIVDDKMVYDYNLYKLLVNNSNDFTDEPFAKRMEHIMGLTYLAYVENGTYMNV